MAEQEVLTTRPVEEKWAQMDPHLQEVYLAWKAGENPNPAITTTTPDGKVWVDVVAELKVSEEELPPDLVDPRYVSETGEAVVTGKVEVGEDILKVHDHANVASLKAATEVFAHLFKSVPAIGCKTAALQEAFPELPGLSGSGVIVGVVDVGCDFRHGNFRHAAGETRLLYLWDQSYSADASRRPANFRYGRELDTRTINQALLAADPYAALGYTPSPGAHGTHVMDIAAGNGREPNFYDGKPTPGSVSNAPPGVAPDASLIFVHVQTSPEGFLGNSSHLIDAVKYIFAKADEKKMPAVVNVSLGTYGGPHDGMTLVERAFAEQLAEKPGRAIVVSAGNAYGRNSHAGGEVTKDKPVELPWRTDPVARKNELEVWYGEEYELVVTVRSPDGETLGPVTLGSTVEIMKGDARVGRISHRKRDRVNQANQIDIRVPASDREWIVRLEVAGNSQQTSVRFDAWIEQDDRGIASFTSGATDDRTLGSIAGAKSTIAVGAYDTFERGLLAQAASFTAQGPTRTDEEKPDVSAPGVGILAARAQGGTTRLFGTSMAAPHVTGLAALLFQAARASGRHPLPTGEEIRQMIRARAAESSAAVTTPWDSRFGAGRLAHGVDTIRDLLAPPAGGQPAAPVPPAAKRTSRSPVAKAALGGPTPPNKPNGKGDLHP